jgi:SAM-dependent methyltransferase
MNELYTRYNEAGKLLYERRLVEQAAAIYIELAVYPEMAPLCYWQLAYIANIDGDPTTAYSLYYQAFEKMPNILRQVYDERHPHRNYFFSGKKEEVKYEKCPLCQGNGAPYWCYPLTHADSFCSLFNPIRMWLHCKACDFLFAEHFPRNPYDSTPKKWEPVMDMLKVYSDILSRIMSHAPGKQLLEVGIGACECILVAREMGFAVQGIDVNAAWVEQAQKDFGLDVEKADFLEYDCPKKWDVIMMGDVLEHMLDPVRALEKASESLNEKGVLWVSAPNLRSAAAAYMGHNDLMRIEPYHISYFSKASLLALAGRFGFKMVDYRISAHYDGSMELILVKA